MQQNVVRSDQELNFIKKWSIYKAVKRPKASDRSIFHSKNRKTEMFDVTLTLTDFQLFCSTLCSNMFELIRGCVAQNH
jgi:hypothetical protein